MKIVINKCYGGFCVNSEWAEINEFSTDDMREDMWRTNKTLIEAIENGTYKDNCYCHKLSIVEIPDGVDWEICNYDGMEWVAEKHRKWF